jgi:hypothetical protein
MSAFAEDHRVSRVVPFDCLKKGETMARTAYFAVGCLALSFVLSPLQGCEGGKEPPQQEVPAHSDPQTKKEQERSPSAEETAEVPPSAPAVEVEVETKAEAESEPVAEPVNEAEASGSDDEIIIENQGYVNDKRKPVKLSHKKHSEEYGIACDSCHHLYQEGTNVWEEGDSAQKCAACHDPVEDQGNVMKLQSAFHKNCRDCHKEMSQEGRNAPYKKCTDCHV